MKIARPKIPRFAVVATYLVVIELLYIFYASALSWSPPYRPEAGLGAGLLFIFASLPSSMLAGHIQWGAARLLGYGDGFEHVFLPHFIASQSAIAINVGLLFLLTRRRGN